MVKFLTVCTRHSAVQHDLLEFSPHFSIVDIVSVVILCVLDIFCVLQLCLICENVAIISMESWQSRRKKFYTTRAAKNVWHECNARAYCVRVVIVPRPLMR